VRRFPYFYPYIGLSEAAKRVLDKKGGSPFSFPLMRALQRSPDLDIIHLHAGNRIGGIGRHVAQQKKIPYIISIHGGVFGVPEEEAQTWSQPTKGAFDWGKVLGWWVGSRQLFDDAAAVLCVDGNEVPLAQEKYPGKHIEHLPNGVDVARFAQGDGAAFRAQHNIPADALVLATIARIDSQKNQQLLARLLPALREQAPNTHLLLIGAVTDQAYYNQLMEILENTGMAEHATVLPGLDGGSQDLVDAYHAADIFTLPSVHEPFGIVILEAWASGLPVIATRIGGIPAFVEDGKDALLFTSNDEEDFLKSFTALANDPEHSETLAAAGKKKAVTQFSWDKITKRLVQIYEEAIRENPLRK
jgi:glycosyltransferase involved in cell wall biosynthesis